MEHTKSLWVLVKEFINSKEPGDIITRKDLVDIDKYSYTSIDQYRKSIHDLGYIDSTNTPGQYVLIERIPHFITAGNRNSPEKIEKLKMTEVFKMI